MEARYTIHPGTFTLTWLTLSSNLLSFVTTVIILTRGACSTLKIQQIYFRADARHKGERQKGE